MNDASSNLPIHDLRERFLSLVETGNRVIVVAPTGSGKTTQLPQYLVDSPELGQGQVVVLQPRRVAARAVARRVCEERGVTLGREVGYQVRFEDRTSKETRLVFMTEGVLLRRWQNQPQLKGISALVLDEFHERSLQSDVVLGLTKQLQAEGRPDLKLIVMSATLDVEPLASYLSDRATSGRCPVLEAEGRTFPVSIRYEARQDRRRASERAADRVAEIELSGEPGDVLVFMPGMAEINATMREIRDRRLGGAVDILPLHGELPAEQQDRVFGHSERRKVIVATNVAESSITIQGVRFVVDGGLARVARFDSEAGLNRLEIEEISQASADQRAGRAGRTGPGICYRLWTESGQLNRLPQTTPEIQRTELSEIVLQLHALGIQRAADFAWLDPPDPVAINQAEALLHLLGAFRTVNSQIELSDIGRKMLRVPTEPRFARMLIEGKRRGCFEEAALCAALVSGRNLLGRGAQRDAKSQEHLTAFAEDERSDFFMLMRAYEAVREGGFRMVECQHYGVNRQVALAVEQMHQQLLQLEERLGPNDGTGTLSEEERAVATLKCLLAGFVDQLCRRRSRGTLECDIVGQRRGTLARESVVQESELLVASDIRTIASTKRGSLTLISQASQVEPAWLREVYPEAEQCVLEHRYDRKQKRVEVFEARRLYDLLLSEEKSKELEPAASGRCLAEAWKDGALSLPQHDHAVQQFKLRVALLAHHHPELSVAPIGEEDEFEIIARALAGERLGKEAQRKTLLPSFERHLSADNREWLAELYPQSWKWVDDRKRKLVYQLPRKKEGGEHVEVILNVSITECFKLTEHPAVGDGAVPITLILGVPKGKELARTTDWPTFKQQEYSALKSRWKQKFPTVIWP